MSVKLIIMRESRGRNQLIQGFSKLSLSEKLDFVADMVNNREKFLSDVEQHMHPDPAIQQRYHTISENTISNYYLPFGIAPNFLVNGEIYHVPMVTEETSVIAAAAAGAKFWSNRGGFHSTIINTTKKGQVHFQWSGNPEKLHDFFSRVRKRLFLELEPLIINMRKRGGGIKKAELRYLPEILRNYYQIDIDFDTADSMGANFINSVLELLAQKWKLYVRDNKDLNSDERDIRIIMSIVSNYTPDCIAYCFVEAPVSDMDKNTSELFSNAFKIAYLDFGRAVTHNKGIFNGIDALMMATGNDFRAIEACGHAFAARNGNYSSLSNFEVNDQTLKMELKLPLALGTVGGLTNIHPMAAYSLEILGKPTSQKLMEIAVAVGLASNFSAIKALVTTGIQAGHMKLHIDNVLAQLGANKYESERAKEEFRSGNVSFSAIRTFLELIREE